jgi:AhpD family alkylhydroperoxidase
VTQALADVEWDVCVLEPRRDPELEAYMRRGVGAVPSSVPYFASVPWVVRSMASLGPLGAPPLHVDTALAELLGLVVSQDNSCRYCFGMQRMMLRVYGFSDRRIHAIESNFLEAEIDPRAKLALEFARRVSRAAPRVTSADAAPLHDAGWRREAVRELAYIAAYDVYMNRLMTVGAVPFAPAERMGNAWLVRGIAPLMRFSMRRLQRRARERAAAVQLEIRGPFAYLLHALADLPCAKPLGETLAAAFASPVLPARGKALIFAVVARGLECPLATSESQRLLLDSGLGADEIDFALTHLSSPRLAPLENELLAFARGTIRGKPLQAQQRTRALAQRLTPEQVVEAIALAALANAVCRLAVVTELE